MKKIMILTGSRGEWGYIRPLMKLAETRDDVHIVLVVMNMHCSQLLVIHIKKLKMMDLKLITR